MHTKIILLILFLVVPWLCAEEMGIPDAARLQLQLKKLTVVGGALYVGANPDDENTAALAYFSLGRLVRAGYLALNRGEGGQNLIGPEQGEALGLIRTQELLAARRIDGSDQFFTRAVDFGFSKSPEESIQMWGKENVLSDVVWIIRKFRPDVIVTRFPKEGGGHGHHTASAILAEEAFYAAADPSRFPEQLRFVSPWKATRLVWNRYSWGRLPPITEEEKASMAKMNVGEYNPLLGKSYTEIAGISRTNHKSQGFGDSQDRGEYVEYLRPTAGRPSTGDLFEGIDLSWKRVPGSEKIATALEEAYRSFQPQQPQASIPALLKAYALMRSFPPNPWMLEKMEDTKTAIRDCAGLWLEAIAVEPTATPGSEVKITATAVNRSSFPFLLESVELIDSNRVEPLKIELLFNRAASKEMILRIPEGSEYSQPYWLRGNGERPFAAVSDLQLIGRPETPAAHQVRFYLHAGKERLDFTVPVLYRWVDPVDGERYRNLDVVPEVAVHLLEPVIVFAEASEKTIRVELKSGAAGVAGQLSLQLPAGWASAPDAASFRFERKDEAATFSFTVQAGPDAKTGEFFAEATVRAKKNSRGMISVDYHHIPPQSFFPPAKGKLIRLELKRNGRNIGYIMGSGDQIPEALKQIGYQVTLLSDEDLSTGNLSVFDSIIAGIRAYNTRPKLMDLKTRLLDYVQQGGTLVVQYNTLGDFDSQQIGPYPFRISRDRVSMEDSPVTMLKPDHSLLSSPNKITQEDFQGWIQERGLYFPDQWDSHYESILATNDPGEPAKEGGTLFTRFGNGVYIYTSYSWFRELPAGVPGAFRLFVNLISAGKQP